MEHVRRIPVPLLLLSATVPPHIEGELREFFRTQFSIIRSPTARANISYRVVKDYGPPNEAVLRAISSEPTTPKSIVFCRGRELTKILAAYLRIHGLTAMHYHGRLNRDSRDVVQNSWMHRDVDIMVAMGAFGTGIDFGAVRLVVHVDEPYSMIDLAQESGRGGRDGMPSKHVVLLPTACEAQPNTPPEVAEYMRGTRCTRWILQDYIGGRGFDYFSSGSKRCDVCHSTAVHVKPAPIGTPLFGSRTADVGGDYMDLFGYLDEDALAMMQTPPLRGSVSGPLCYPHPPQKRKIDMRANRSLYWTSFGS